MLDLRKWNISEDPRKARMALVKICLEPQWDKDHDIIRLKFLTWDLGDLHLK